MELDGSASGGQEESNPPGALLLPLLQSLFCLFLVSSIARLWQENEAHLQLRRVRQGWVRSGGAGAGPLPPAPHPLGPPQPPLYTLVRMQVVAGLLGGIIQLLATVTKMDVSQLLQTPAGAASPSLAVLALLVGGMLVPALAPRWFERHRTPLFAATRMLYFSLPTIRSPRTIAHVFQGQPAHGRFSKLRDIWLLTLGARGLPLLLGPVFLPLPLLQHLAVSAFAIYRVRVAADMCQLPMLQHPIWQRRIRWVHLTAEMLPLVTPQLSRTPPLGGGSSTGGGSSASGESSSSGGEDAAPLDCRVFISFYQLLLVAFSLLLAARLEAPHGSHVQAQAAAAAAAGRTQRDARSGGTGPGAGTGGSIGRWLLRQLGWVRSMAAEAEGLVRQLADLLMGRGAPSMVQVASWSLLLSFCWNLAQVLEQPRLAWLPAGLRLAGDDVAGGVHQGA